MARGKAADKKSIHEKIWAARDRRNTVRINQGELAAALELNPTHMNRIIREFEAQGRLRKVGARQRNVGVYEVRDPAEFDGGSGGVTAGLSPGHGPKPSPAYAVK